MRNVKVRKRLLSVLFCIAVICATATVIALQSHSVVEEYSAAPTSYWTAASSFDKFTDGKTYKYSTSTGEETVTVSSAATYGTITNPYVINTPQQWALFAEKINANTVGYFETDKVYVLNSELDLNNYYTLPVGNSATGFQGKFFGQKHSVKNAYIKQNSTDSTLKTYVGLFSRTTNVTITDLSMDKSCQMIDNETTRYMGGICAFGSKSTFVNCTSNFDVRFWRELDSDYGAISIGGICGASNDSSYYKCTMRGDITSRTALDTAPNANDCTMLGGIVGAISSTTCVIDNCFIDKITITTYKGGPNIGGLIGRMHNGNKIAFNISNCYIDFTGIVNGGQTPDVGCVMGWIGITGQNVTLAPNASIKNIYMTGGSANLMSTAVSSVVINANDGQLTEVYTSSDKFNTLGNIGTSINKLGDDTKLYEQAQKDLSATGNWNFSSDGKVNIIGEPASEFNITYNLNGGTQGANPPSSYNNTIVTALPTPTKSGFNFSGWAKGSNNGTKITSIAVGTSGNLDLYAVWTIADLTESKVTANKTSVTYGTTITLTAEGKHAASGITFSYQWYKGSAALNGKTSSTLTLSNVADSGLYKCSITANAEGQSKTKESNSVTVTINKATPTLTAPTASGTAYVGQKLNVLTLTGGTAKNGTTTVAGSFAWTTSTTKIDSTSKAYSVTFTPTDTANYNNATTNVTATATQLTVKFVDKFDNDKIIATKNVDYGSTLLYASFPDIPSHAGYAGAYDVTSDITNITANKTVNINYTANTNTKYIVQHFKQNIDGKYPATASETENKTGTTDTQATATAKTYAGFTYAPSAAGTVTAGNIAGDGSLALKLYYTRNNYTVTYELNGGTGTESASFKYEAKITKPTDPTNAGYIFGGWYKEANFGTAWDFTTDTMPLDGVTLYAKWTLDDVSENTVEADKPTTTYGNGKVTLTATATHGGTNNTANPVSLSYQWYKGSEKLTGKTASTLVLDGIVADSGDYKCEVTAAGMGQTKSLMSEAVTVTVNKAKPKISGLTATDVFIGQSLSDSTLAGGKAVNEAAADPTAAVAGTFAWTTPATEVRASGAYNVTFTPADTANYETVTLDVQLTATQLTVTFVEQFGGSQTTKTVNVDYNATLRFADFPQITEHTGYTGSYDRTTDITNITDFVTVNVTYAPNTDTAYTVLHIRQDANGNYPESGELVETDNLTGTTGVQVTATEKTYEGFTFDNEKTGSLRTGNIAPDGSLVLKVYYARNSYNLYLNLKGGSGVNSTTVLYDCPVVRPADPTRNGYTFMGWYKEDNYVNLWRFVGDINADLITGNTTIYAKWEAKTYKIAYTQYRIINGVPEVDISRFAITPAEGNPADYTVISPSFVLNAPTAEGHTFLGWYVKDSDIKISQVVTGSTGDLYLEARWTPAEYSVRFDAQGGKASLSSMRVTNLGRYGELPTATKDGATFVGWYMGQNGTGIKLETGSEIFLKGDLTVYAYWQEIEYRIEFDESTGDTLNVTVDGAPFDWHVSYVKTGDVLNLSVVPADGYSVIRLIVNGRSASNGGNFLVKSGYADNKITISALKRLTTYTITYYLNGGVQGTPAAGSSWATSYNVETPDIELPPPTMFDSTGEVIPDSKTPTKVGYYFNGWCYDKALTDPAGDYITQGTTGNISLYADWAPALQEIVYRGNYGGAGTDEIDYGLTDETITLKACSFESRAERVDFKFLGWSTTPNGAVEYKDQAEYKVKPYDNVLYAIWHVANMQFVDITVKNDQIVYGSNTDGIVLTPQPGYAYTSKDVTLTYQWYRLDTNGVYVKYGEPVVILASDAANADGTNKASIRIHSVAECGTFKCTLTATGTTDIDAKDAQGNPIKMVTTAEGEGTRTVTMEKAVFDQISFVDQTFEYDGAPHSITIGNPADLPAEISVSYTGNGVIKTGTFNVVAVFTVPDTSNYKPIDSMKATLTITPKKITSITFKGDKSAPDLFTYTYNGNPFTVTAEFSDVLTGDDVRATMSDNSFTAAGNYTALVTGIEGADSGNYVLAPSLTGVSRNFTINKANYDTSAIRFAGKTVTYNGSEQSLRVTGGLPAGVTVEYTMTYTPFSAIGGVSGAGNGGANAGTYVITAIFKGDADNYNAIEPMQATLVISKGNFTLDYGEFRNTTVSYGVGTYYNPQIDLASQSLTDRLSVAYSYLKGDNGMFNPFEVGANGLNAAGVYKIVAQFEFLQDIDINNYNEIPAKTIMFNITDLEVARLTVENYSSRNYVVGDNFDPGELVVTVWYKDGSHEVLDGSRFNIDPVVFDKAGDCVVTVTYMSATGTFNVNVGKGEYDLSGITVENETSASYDKQAHLPELSGELPAGVTPVYSYSTDGTTYQELPAGGLTNAASYFIKIGFVHQNTDNYNNITLELNCKLIIARAEIAIVFGESEFLYDGTEHVLTAKGMFGSEEITLTLTGNRATDAGEYTAAVSLDESITNYKLPAIGTSKVWTIAAQEVSVEFVTPTDPYVYNGGEQTVTVIVKDQSNNVIDAKAVVSFGKDVKFTDAGDYTATVVGLLNADGSACVNYKLPNAADAVLSKAYTILPDTVEAVWEVNIATDGGENWVAYDPSASQLVYTGASLTSKLRAGFYYGADEQGKRVYHDLTLDFGGENFVNAGKYAVSATGTDTNFTVSGGAMTIDIAPKATKVFFVVKTGEGVWQPLAEATLIYKGRAYEIRAYYVNNAGGQVELAMTVAQNGSDAQALNAGNYTLTAAFVFKDDNYTLTDTTADLSIGQKEITIEWTDPADLVYDGANKKVTASIPDALVGDDISLTLTNNEKTEAGTYTATATLAGAAAGNYTIAAGYSDHAFTVKPREITITIKDKVVKYSGSEPTEAELAAIAYEITAGSRVNGETLTITFAKSAGVDVKDGGYAITGSCDNGNYKVTFVGNYAADSSKGLYLIEKADPSVDPYYDATLYEGKKLTASALKLNAGTPGTIAFDDVSASLMLAPGSHEFDWTFTPTDTTNYNVKKGKIAITVVAVELEKIEVTTPPGKVSYLIDSYFDPTGIVVTATFNNGATEPVQDDVKYTIGGADALTHKLAKGDNKILVTYTRDGVTKTCELGISVTDKVVTELTIETQPNKVEYVEGQKFSADGMKLKATYQDGSSEIITDNWAISPEGALTISHTKVVVTYGEKSVEIPLTVVRKAVESIEIVTPPTKTSYIEGTAFDATGIAVMATYNDGTTANITADDLTWDGAALALGDSSVRIGYSYGGKTAYADQSVTVTAKKIVSIEITTAPDKTVYDAFTRFDATGMVVTATYDNNTTAVIDDYEVINGELTVDDTSVTIKAGDATATVAITVEPVDFDMSGISFDGKTFSYDGAAHGIAVAGLPAGVTVLYKVNGGDAVETVSVTEIGTYTIEAVFTTDDPNYKPLPSLTATLTISELLIYATDEIGIDVDAEIVYNGETQAPRLVGNIKDANGNALDFAAAGIEYELTVTKNGELAEIYHSGVYQITVVFSHNNAAYASIDDLTFTVTVTKAELTLTVDDAKIFAGQDAPAFTYTLSGFQGTDNADSVTIEGSVDCATDYVKGDAAGTYAINAVGTPTAEDYTFAFVSGTLTVEAVSVEKIEITVAPDKTEYIVGETFDPTGMEVRAYYNDGSDKAVTDYTYSDDALTIDVTEVEIAYGEKTAKVAVTVALPVLTEEIVFADASVVYDGNTHTIEATEIPAGVTVEYLIDGASDSASKEAGTYVITAKFTVTDGSAVIADKTATLTITPRELTPEWVKTGGLIADGTEKTPQILLNGLLEGDDAGLTLTYNEKPIAAGRYVAQLEIANTNYTLAAREIAFEVRSGSITGMIVGSDQPGVVIEGGNGFKADTEVAISSITDDKEIDKASSSVDGKLNYLYDISLISDGQDYQPDEKVTVRLLITDRTLFYKDLRVYRFEDDGAVTDMNAVRDGDYMVFETDHFSRYAVVSVGESTGIHPALLGVIIGAAVLLAAAAVVIIVFQMKKMKRRAGGNTGKADKTKASPKDGAKK